MAASDEVVEPRVSARSELGLVRAVNEDSVLARFPVYIVADGMGGHARGDVASRTTIAALDAAIPDREPVAPARVIDAVHRANAAIRATPVDGGGISGTTLSGVVAVRAGGRLHWMIVNVGDSRVYRWNGRALTQLTVDHSVVQELIDAGAISSADAATHPDRNTITRALGASDDLDVDAWLVSWSEAHTFLICSDGVTKELDHATIEGILAGHQDVDGGVADAIVAAAIAAGGRDNVSAIVVETSGAEAPDLVGTGTRDRAFDLDDTRPRSML